MRRAKLGFVYGVQVPILEALAKHQVLSVASVSATRTAKRTQGGDGPQCESVKGFSPDMNVKLWMPTPCAARKAISRQSIATTAENPPGL
ncbi:hypothetical protein [Stenomitos frigidus]|uniref:hypothetical protein n=1 Tax=Stenomitos frigidus TaxID=1886765 RepID=UPI0015E7804A|nr:hypothetical protein [Stenomitos frigidus]